MSARIVTPVTVTPVSGRSLTPEENERVIEAVRKLLAENGNNQSALGKELKSTQSTVSGLLARRHRAGYGFARNVAAKMGVKLDELLGTERRIEYERDPKLARMALGQHNDWKRAREEAVARFGRFMDEAVLDEAAEMVLSNMPEHLTAEVVKGFHDALAKAKGLM
jgi:transcriptional regulator with XRE-family HTH domain